MRLTKTKTATLIVVFWVFLTTINAAGQIPRGQYPYGSGGEDQKLDFHRTLSQQDSLTPPYGYENPAAQQPQLGPAPLFVNPPAPRVSVSTPLGLRNEAAVPQEEVMALPPTSTNATIAIPFEDYKKLVAGKPLSPTGRMEVRPDANSKREGRTGSDWSFAECRVEEF